MQLLKHSAIVVFVSLIVFKTPVWGQSSPNVHTDQAEWKTSSIWFMATSLRLFEMGRLESDPYLILTAAKLLKRADLQKISMPSEQDGVTGLAEPKSPVLMDWQRMLEIAEKMSGGAEIITGLAEDIRVFTDKGVVDGAVYSESTIKPRSKRFYRDLPFEGGQYAEVISVGHPATNLDMFIYDGNGHLICSQTDPSNISQCGWTPNTTGPFTIVMENKGDIASAYALTTN